MNAYLFLRSGGYAIDTIIDALRTTPWYKTVRAFAPRYLHEACMYHICVGIDAYYVATRIVEIAGLTNLFRNFHILECFLVFQVNRDLGEYVCWRYQEALQHNRWIRSEFRVKIPIMALSACNVVDECLDVLADPTTTTLRFAQQYFYLETPMLVARDPDVY